MKPSLVFDIIKKATVKCTDKFCGIYRENGVLREPCPQMSIHIESQFKSATVTSPYCNLFSEILDVEEKSNQFGFGSLRCKRCIDAEPSIENINVLGEK